MVSADQGVNISTIDSFVVTTTAINQKSGELIDETVGMFDFSHLNTPDATVLF